MKYENLTLDEERALYAVHGAQIIKCNFDGPADGESALKEAGDINVNDCRFNLRYPFWHVNKADIQNIEMTDKCRAALWYDAGISISNSRMHGIKALRECSDIEIRDTDIVSAEFGWRCSDVRMHNVKLESEYPFFNSRSITLDGFTLKGKYSFQYVENMSISHANMDTKDAFWHTKNVTVTDSVIKGEYLAWYSENLRLIRCRIIGTQPLCYCKGLVLEDCEMIDTDLSFERSEVQATIKGDIISVKNPVTGFIKADSIGEIILDEYLPEGANCVITTIG